MSIEAADRGGTSGSQPGTASSPYASGGGGVTFAHRVAAVYLTSVLTGTRRTELGEHPATSVSFQTAPAHAVDDLLVTADVAGEPIDVAIACRATPNFVPSDADTVSLIKTVLADIEAHEGPTSTVVIAVAGWKDQWNQVAQLCEIARNSGKAADFNTVLSQDGIWGRPVRDRHGYLCDMVALATGNKRSRSATDAVRAKTWSMLNRLRVVGFDVQAPRDAEWTATASLLDSVTSDSANGIALRDALASRAATYDATGAKSVTVHTVRRDMRGIVDRSVGRPRRVWDALTEQRRAALASVRHTLRAESSDGAPLQLKFEDRRKQLSGKVLRAAETAGAVVVSGESGTGKSALVLSTVLELESNPANSLEAVILNMRELPNDSLSLHSALGASLIEVLGQLDAPRRLLVVDGADVAAERSSGVLRGLLSAAFAASVAVVLVSADIALDFVTEQVHAFHTGRADRYAVDPLNDDDLAQVATHVPALTGMLREAPKASLLRRLVVLDLLSRTGVTLDHPMREWDCLELIWATVVRGDGRPVSGSAEARDRTLVLLANAALDGAETVHGLDAESIDALRADHLLAPHSAFHQLPQFAHDEVRRYATAMHLVRRSDIPDAVASAGTPRWALSAATLACKGKLSDPSAAPSTIFTGMVGGFRDVALNGAARWADVPIEAVLDTDSAYACLNDTVRKKPANLDLEDVIRVVQQRLAGDGLVDLAADPVIRLLLDDPTPWLISNAAFKLLNTWLRTTALVWCPAGHKLRVRLRERLLDFWDRYPVQPPPAESEINSLFARGRQRRRHLLDYRLTDAEYVETLAMLGKDINADIETCLRAIANDSPAYLAPAADSPFSARSLVQYKPEFLAELMEAYYIDDDLDDSWSHHDEGIREHDSKWSGIRPPFSAHYFGSFWTLFQAAHLDTSVRVFNNILNHAAKARVRLITGPHQPFVEHGVREDDELPGAALTQDGATRNYIGDGGTWSWYRGTSTGPYPCMSALQAMERVLEPVFQIDDAVQPAVEKLLAGCENLAVPGLLYGLLVRNIEHAGASLDPFLAEPEVWDLEFSRYVSEHYSFRAGSEGLAHPERRAWTPREACMTLVSRGDEDRRAALKVVGDLLKKNGDRLGKDSLVVRTWAAHLDIERFRFERNEDQTYLVVRI